MGGWDGLPPGAGMMISSVSVGRRFCAFLATCLFSVVFGFPSRDSSSTNPFVLTRWSSLLCGGLTRCGLGVWMHPRPEQLASVGHHSFAVKRPGIFLLAFVRGLALVRAGESWETVPLKPRAPGVQVKTQ